MAEIIKTICWIRRDLRLHDHRVLAQATRGLQKTSVCFVYDKNILQTLPKNDRRLSFIFESLQQLDAELQKYGSRLITVYGDPVEEIPLLAKKLKARTVFCGEDYEPSAIKRDLQVQKKLSEINVSFESVKDQVIFSGREILNQKEQPYRVFTPYKNAWLKMLKAADYAEARPDLKNLISSEVLGEFGKFLNLGQVGFEPAELIIKPGIKGGRALLKKFAEQINSYDKNRNLVHLNVNSMLSPHLRFGTISVREAVRLAQSSKSEGARVWLNELIWREFYQMILLQFPYVEKKSFNLKYQDIKWPGTNAHFKAWCEGKTGYPIVDSAMRYFNQTGWMHNRLRMIVASFLVKDLLVDWRKGEKYFAQRLLDFDLASNNGGWQWCASTGVDAQPYFRVFNPTVQGEKFDPEAEFIRQNLPERRAESFKTIFLPKNPIVDHKTQSRLAVRLYSE